MAGHSHWANISAKKGVIDKKRGKLFGKLSKAIIVAAQHGGHDPAANLKLRYAISPPFWIAFSNWAIASSYRPAWAYTQPS